MDTNEDRIIQLQDEDGHNVDFKHLMTLEYEGYHYVVLEAVQDIEECMEGEALILKIIQDKEGEDIYVTIEDEGELQAVFDKCMAILEEQDDDEADLAD